MNKISNLPELQSRISNESLCLVYIKTENCGVCDVVLDKTFTLLTKFPKLTALLVNMHETPDASSAFLVFTAPTIILFVEGKEVYRASRFVLFNELEDRLDTWYKEIYG